jgi:hypothetical protein
MKIILIGLASVSVLFLLSQVLFNRASNNIEMYKYEVVKEFDGFEIRAYESANFSYVTMDKGSYEQTSRNGFRKLAGYIFGNNEGNQKIAMTSPVAMTMEDSVTMMFMLPSEYGINDMPKPNDPNVKFRQEPEKHVAAIGFGGWANDKKIGKYTQKLKDLLKANGIDHKDKFSYLGYNAPFEMMDRRNEIIVEVDLISEP